MTAACASHACVRVGAPPRPIAGPTKVPAKGLATGRSQVIHCSVRLDRQGGAMRGTARQQTTGGRWSGQSQGNVLHVTSREPDRRALAAASERTGASSSL